MCIVVTSSGEICEAEILAQDKWDFIEKYLSNYSQDTLVTLSNDIAVVLDVIADGYNPKEYMRTPEHMRDYSDISFNNVMQYVKDITDAEELLNLQREVDEELFANACDDYKSKYQF